MKRRIVIYNILAGGVMAEEQSFRRRYFFSKKKWWTVYGGCSVGCSHIEMEMRTHDVRDWVLERVKKYKDKNIQIDIVNESRYNIFNFF
jgi:hypothetical protein